MRCFDVFNGDADGICALQQLRLAEPRPEAELVTGVKREIDLLERVVKGLAAAGGNGGGSGEDGGCESEGRQDEAAAGGLITVLDISLDRNRRALQALPANWRVFYVDHHYAGEIPAAPGREFHLDAGPDICTSLLVDKILEGRFRAWAVAGAFGDNLHEPARRAAAALGLSGAETEDLRELGELLNYNGYGQRLEDLHFHPARLYRALHGYRDPLEFRRQAPELAALREGFRQDLERARTLRPLAENAAGRVFRLPAAAWSRRVSGVFANELARRAPELAHALLVERDDGALLVSVRAPLQRPGGADGLCRRFPTGGGRAAAAGINALPPAEEASFIDAFTRAFS